MKPPTGTKLSLEGERSIHQPTVDILCNAVDRMKPVGPSFLIVERAGGDYAQAGGGRGEYLFERREFGEPFIHLVAGKGAPKFETHKVRMSCGYTQIRSHEVLSAEDVKTLLVAFLLNDRWLEGYSWRNITQDFIDEADPREVFDEWAGN